jgi:hypothetical protein
MSFTDADVPAFDGRAKDHDTAFPEFEMKPVRGADKDGVPSFTEQEFVTIRVPGDRRTEWHGRVTDAHRTRFRRQYDAWKQGREAPTEGTPLSEVAWINRAQVEELAYQHVKTVEALAGLSDAQLKGALAMGGYPLRDRAKRHLEEIAGAAPAQKLAAENAELKGTIDTMQGQLAEALRRLDEMAAQKANAGAETA